MRRILAAAIILGFALPACATKSALDLGGGSPTPTPTSTPSPTPTPPCSVSGAVCSVGSSGNGDGGPFLSGSLSWPYSMARDAAGNLYIADTTAARIRKVDAITGLITTIAGTGESRGPIQTGVLATQARIGEPTTIAVAPNGWIYWASPWYEQTIFGIDPATGRTAIVAGNGSWGVPTNGPATLSAMDFDDKSLITVDSSGIIFLPDTYNSVVRAINPGGTDAVVGNVSVPAGDIVTVAGTGTAGMGATGSQALSTQIREPSYVFTRGPGNGFFVVDGGNHRIITVAGNGVVFPSVGTGVQGFSGDGGAAISARLDHPAGMQTDGAGHAFIQDSWNQRIRLVNFTGSAFTFAGVTVQPGQIETIAGFGYEGWLYENGSNALSQGFNFAASNVVYDGANLLIVDTWNGVIRKLDGANGTMSVVGGFAGGTSFDTYWEWPGGLALDASGNVLLQAGSTHLSRIDVTTGAITNAAGSGVGLRSGDGGLATAAGFDASDLATLADGTIFVADADNHVVRMIDPAGIISTIAGSGVGTSAGDGGAAVSATFEGPDAVAVDAAGNLFLADANRIRFLNRTNAPITLANVTVAPGAIDRIAGTGAAGFSGDGGQAAIATFRMRSHNGFAVSGASLFVSDYGNHRIRVIDLASGVISTLAGDGTDADRGDGGPASLAWVGRPTGLAVRGADLYWAQEARSVIRKVALSGGTVQRVAGGGDGFSGDGGPASEALLLWPQKIAFAADGSLFIADSSHRVRRIQAGASGLLP